MSLREKLYCQLQADDEISNRLSFLNWILVVVIIGSFVLMALETEKTFSTSVLGGIAVAQKMVVFAFAIEFVARIWAMGEEPRYQGLQGRMRLLTKPLIWLDFLAFAPELMLVIFFPASASAMVYARALRILRLFKLFRYFRAFNIVFATLKAAKEQLLASLMIASVIIYLSAYALFLTEGSIQPEQFGSVPRALWWSVATLTTVGYGDTYPVTVIGKIMAALSALVGVAMVALPAGILASTFQQKLEEDGGEK